MTGLICLFLCSLTTCSPFAEVSTRYPDEALFESGMDAARQKRFTVAYLTLETLVNTYPDSPYAGRATVALQNPQIANCGDSFTTSAECDDLKTIEAKALKHR